MNKKLEIGMYVRNDYFGIGKIDKDYFDSNNKHWFNVQFNCYGDDDCHCGICEQSIGYKASNNITDLIEDGDILRLENNQVIQIFPSDKEKIERFLIYNVDTKKYHWGAYEIKSIVAKEQFKSVELEVK